MAVRCRALGLLGTVLAAGLCVAPVADQPATRQVSADRAVAASRSLPEPPRQKAAWKAPGKTSLSEPLVQAVDLLFTQGVAADPRGCEYRAVEIAVGNVWNGGGKPVATHAWVLPADGGGAERFAVAWNGLVYPVGAVGEKADLAADVASILAADDRRREELRKSRPDVPYENRWWSITHEDRAVSHAEPTRLKVALLLRAGEVELAERYDSRFPIKTEGEKEDPYLVLAEEWAWCAFDRAVCAHMRGDDRLSAATARLLSAARSRIEETAARRWLAGPRRSDPNDSRRELPNPPYIGFLGPLDRLLPDSERRATGADRPLPLADAVKIADKAKRIAALVRCLENVAERQWGQPGGVGLDGSPIVMALEKEGEDAVEPLIACLEGDERLTRSVSFSRDFNSDRRLIGVAGAAHAALAQILKTQELVDRGADRKAAAAQVRALWARTKGKTAAQRWYATLADDNATHAQWVEAATRIVRPTDVEERGGWIRDHEERPGEVAKLWGDELRAVSNPSVSQLLAKRVPQIASAGNPASSLQVYNADNATRVALALAKWDPEAAGPVLRAQLDDCRAKAERWSRHGSTETLSRNISDLSTALAAMGGRDSLKSYGERLRVQSPKDEREDLVKLFEPLWRNPEDADVRAAVASLFGDPASPWRDLSKLTGPARRRDDLLASPLIAVEGFRAHVLSALRDTSPVGTLTVRDGQASVKLDGGGLMGFAIMDVADPLLPKDGETRTLRVCDAYAAGVARLRGAPVFERYWPEKARDVAVGELSNFLGEWGPRYAWNADQKALYRPPFESAHLTFPRRQRPATEADVKARGAIFSLAGGEVKVVPLQRFPSPAKWKTLTRFVQRQFAKDPKTGQQTVAVTHYDNEGLVWQAEEVIEGGTWKRYYGFVGRHVIAKVPADEIEFTNGP